MELYVSEEITCKQEILFGILTDHSDPPHP